MVSKNMVSIGVGIRRGRSNANRETDQRLLSLSPTILITSKNIGPYFYDRGYRRIHFHKMHAYFNRGKSFLVSMSMKRIIVQVVRNM